MKKFVALILIALTLSGCVAVPVYDGGYYYAPYPYIYWGPEVSVFFSGGHGRGHNYGGHGHRGWRR